MPPTKIGAVVYEDDNVVFRIIFPLEYEDDSVLDDPQWTTVGCDLARKARLVKLDTANPDWSQFAGIEASIAGFANGSFHVQTKQEDRGGG